MTSRKGGGGESGWLTGSNTARILTIVGRVQAVTEEECACNECGEIQLEEINKELQEVFAEDDEEVVYDPFINGFELSVVEDTRTPVGSLKRRYAIAKNKLGIIMLKGEPSFSASDQILMDELKFYITQNDLKAN